jgi:thiol:disulfide interchange protein DsbC
MKRKIPLIITVFIILCAGCTLFAAKQHHEAQQAASPQHHDAVQHNCAACHTLSKAEAETLLSRFGVVKDVRPSPVKGLYEVTLQQGNRQMAAYVDYGKKLILGGPIYAIATRQIISPLPAEVPVKLSNQQLDRINLEDSIIMGNRNGKKRLFVFTDPDCGYCKRLHGELKKLVSMEPDLAIYIKMDPLRMHPGAYDKARVILASGSLDMLDKAFAGGKLPPAGEKTPREQVDATIRLAESLGIKGTPALVFPDGRLIIGFRNAENMHALLTPENKKDLIKKDKPL